MRKTKVITIDAEGRDQGKHFLLVEMSAMQAESWAARALMALSKAGVEVPEEAFDAGLAGVAAAGLASFAKVAFEDAEPLMDEMLACVSFCPDPTKIDPLDAQRQRPISRALIHGDAYNDGDISEVRTLLRLRSEVTELHLGFSPAAALQTFAAAISNSNQPASPTSPKSAEPSSHPAKRRSGTSKLDTH